MPLYKEKFSAEETRDILRLFGAFWDITGRLIKKKQAPKTKIIKKTIDHLKKKFHNTKNEHDQSLDKLTKEKTSRLNFASSADADANNENTNY